MLNEADELPHLPPDPLPDRWQENFFIVARSTDQHAAFFVHCKRWPVTGSLTARVAVSVGDVVVSRRVHEPIDPSAFRVDGLTLDVDEPYQALRISGGFSGAAGYGPLGFIATSGPGPVPVDIDLQLSSELAPADFEEGFRMLASAFADERTDGDALFEATQQHYEQGGRCVGSIAVDGVRHLFDGLFVRDHTWGLRDETAMSAAGHGFWTASALNDGTVFFNATGIATATGVRGLGVVVDASGQHVTDELQVSFSPEPHLYGFNTTQIRIGGARPIEVTGSGDLHLVKYLPGSGPGRFDDNLIADVRGEGLVGFGVHEFAGTLTPGQAHVLDLHEARTTKEHSAAAPTGRAYGGSH